MASSSKHVSNEPLIEMAKSIELVARDNICDAAFLKVMERANNLEHWNFPKLPWGSLHNLQQIFERPESSNTIVECSIERGNLPVKPNILISMMMDKTEWCSYMRQIIKVGNSEPVVGADPAIKNLQLVDVEYWLPTPCVETRSFHFLRFLKVPLPGFMAVIDVSNDFLADELHPLGLNNEFRRLPSGLLIRENSKKESEFFWIENVEVVKQPKHHRMYRGASESNWPFGAKRWVNILNSIFKRKTGFFEIISHPCSRQVFSEYLLRCAERMKSIFLGYVQKASEDSVKQAQNGNHKYVTVNSFTLATAPCRVLEILKSKYIELQGMELMEELCRFIDSDKSYCIAAYRVQIQRDKSTAYLLQEVSTDEYCSFVISALVTKENYDDVADPTFFDIRPSGIAITPGGPLGIKSHRSLVTAVLQIDCSHEPESFQDQVIQRTSDFELQIGELVKQFNFLNL